MTMPHKLNMLPFYKNPHEVGLDESGRGPLFGRVYAGAVRWGTIEKTEENKEYYNLVIDSKKLTSVKRKKVIDWIKQNVAAWGVGYSEPEEIDQINILEATCLAMKRALKNLKDMEEEKKEEKEEKNIKNIENLIIDGCHWSRKFPEYNCPVTSIVKGDDKYLSIAAASILAKEYHDEHIHDLCRENPELAERYDLFNNKGYATKRHLEGIEKYGPSAYHRKSFKPIRKD